MATALILMMINMTLNWNAAFADEPVPSPSPSGKGVSAHVLKKPIRIRPVGVKATDPSLNGEVNTTGKPSISNTSSMGAGVQIPLNGKKDDGKN